MNSGRSVACLNRGRWKKNKRFICFCFVLNLSFSFSGVAEPSHQPSAEEVPARWSECFRRASLSHGVSEKLLFAIAITESNLVSHALNINGENSYDVGLMQINSFWFPTLQDHGISIEDLYDPCTNIQIGAWILADSIFRYGDNWRAVGAYNAGTAQDENTEQRRIEYAQKVYDNYLSVSRGGLFPAARIPKPVGAK